MNTLCLSRRRQVRRPRVLPRLNRVVIALGSNQGDSVAHVATAMRKLRSVLARVQESPLEVSTPFHRSDQPPYVNAVVVGYTRLSAPQCLVQLKRWEAEAGRNMQAARYTSRPIDLDIVDYGNQVWVTPDLVLPHPARLKRRFVMHPWARLQPRHREQQTGQQIRHLDQRARRWEGIYRWQSLNGR